MKTDTRLRQLGQVNIQPKTEKIFENKLLAGSASVSKYKLRHFCIMRQVHETCGDLTMEFL